MSVEFQEARPNQALHLTGPALRSRDVKVPCSGPTGELSRSVSSVDDSNMRRNSKIQTVIIWLATALVGALAQTAPPQNVKDYFYALPEKFFESEKNKTANWMLSHQESVVDLNNGYLFAQGDGAQPSIWVCLFKKKDSNHLVAVQTTAGDTDEITYLYFYLYEQGKWRDVTKQTLPVKHNEQYRHNLPRYGRTIKVTTPTGQKLYDWEWDREKFIVKK